MIPRTIHRFWDGPPQPDEYQQFAALWSELHPDWNVFTWNESSFLDMFGYHPQKVLLYGDRARRYYSPASTEWQWKTNIARLLILEHMGGVWVDADMEPLKPIDDLVRDPDMFVCARENRSQVNNAFMAARPLHDATHTLVSGLEDRCERNRRKRSNRITGPHYVTDVVSGREDVTILDSELVYPVHWSQLHRLHDTYPDAYMKHHWHNKQQKVKR